MSAVSHRPRCHTGQPENFPTDRVEVGQEDFRGVATRSLIDRRVEQFPRFPAFLGGFLLVGQPALGEFQEQFPGELAEMSLIVPLGFQKLPFQINPTVQTGRRPPCAR